MKPFFSIGVTTYNRREMLKECLFSILSQTFSDFEVLVGNDYPQESLSSELLGIHDSRIQFINHPQNLGEINNMNTLLRMSRGRYFTWFADDDMYALDFLQAVHAALVRYDFPPCVFTSYMSGSTFYDDAERSVRRGQLFTGSQFVQLYLARKLKAIGCYGIFNREYIRQNGAMEQLGVGFSPYSDNLLVIRSGLLEKVVYIDTPLVFFRTHEQSISYTSPDIGAYMSAQEDLFCECIKVFRSGPLSVDFHSNLFLLLRWCIGDIATVVRRSGFIDRRQAISYLFFIKRCLSFLRDSAFYWRMIGLLANTALQLTWDIGIWKVKRWVNVVKRSR